MAIDLSGVYFFSGFWTFRHSFSGHLTRVLGSFFFLQFLDSSWYSYRGIWHGSWDCFYSSMFGHLAQFLGSYFLQFLDMWPSFWACDANFGPETIKSSSRASNRCTVACVALTERSGQWPHFPGFIDSKVSRTFSRVKIFPTMWMEMMIWECCVCI